MAGLVFALEAGRKSGVRYERHNPAGKAFSPNRIPEVHSARFKSGEPMMEPVELADFFVVFFSSAAIILCGALYALIFAWSRVRNMPRLMPFAYAAYAALFASVVALGNAANLFGSYFWISVVILMLAGYLAAPHVIWHLCVNTHAAADCGVPAAARALSSKFGNPDNLQRPHKEETS